MELKITKKPIEVDSDTRILYLSIVMLFIIYYAGLGKKKTISLLKIHLLLWAIKTTERQNSLLTSLEKKCELSIGFWNINIKNNSVLTILIKDNLCEFNAGKYYLTEDGFSFVKNIIKLKILEHEQVFLKAIGKRLTDINVNKLKNLWS